VFSPQQHRRDVNYGMQQYRRTINYKVSRLYVLVYLVNNLRRHSRASFVNSKLLANYTGVYQPLLLANFNIANTYVWHYGDPWEILYLTTINCVPYPIRFAGSKMYPVKTFYKNRMNNKEKRQKEEQTPEKNQWNWGIFKKNGITHYWAH